MTHDRSQPPSRGTRGELRSGHESSIPFCSFSFSLFSILYSLFSILYFLARGDEGQASGGLSLISPAHLLDDLHGVSTKTKGDPPIEDLGRTPHARGPDRELKGQVATIIRVGQWDPQRCQDILTQLDVAR